MLIIEWFDLNTDSIMLTSYQRSVSFNAKPFDVFIQPESADHVIIQTSSIHRFFRIGVEAQLLYPLRLVRSLRLVGII